MIPVLPIPPPPKRRYPEINEQVEELVSNWVCEYCETKNRIDERRCTECGAPMARRRMANQDG